VVAVVVVLVPPWPPTLPVLLVAPPDPPMPPVPLVLPPPVPLLLADALDGLPPPEQEARAKSGAAKLARRAAR
jgi:hypothetical protein